jgi:hypothetical protein
LVANKIETGIFLRGKIQISMVKSFCRIRFTQSNKEMGAMKLLKTTVTETTVHMRYADDPDPAKATSWIDFHVPTKALTYRKGGMFGDPEAQWLGDIQVAAIRHVRNIIIENSRQTLGKMGLPATPAV